MAGAQLRVKTTLFGARSPVETENLARIKLFVLLWAAVAAAGMLTAYIVSHMPGHRFDQVKALEAYVLIPYLISACVVSSIGPAWAPGLLQTFPVPYCLAGGFIWAVQIYGVATWIHRRFLRPRLVFNGIGPAMPVEPFLGAAFAVQGAAIPWRDPKTGDRLGVWSGLLRFAADNAGTGTSTVFGWPTFPAGQEPPSYQEFAFQWTIIAGQAGAGKSRMAMECARHLGKAKARENWSPWRWRRTMISEWCRRKWPWCRRHPAHPWDTGLIPPSPGGIYLSSLATWRPRRPTFLVLDDPQLEASRAVLDIFNNQHQNFRHPVRLLIVDQVLPAELNFRFSDAGNAWASSYDGFHRQVFFLLVWTAQRHRVPMLSCSKPTKGPPG